MWTDLHLPQTLGPSGVQGLGTRRRDWTVWSSRGTGIIFHFVSDVYRHIIRAWYQYCQFLLAAELTFHLVPARDDGDFSVEAVDSWPLSEWCRHLLMQRSLDVLPGHLGRCSRGLALALILCNWCSVHLQQLSVFFMLGIINEVRKIAFCMLFFNQTTVLHSGKSACGVQRCYSHVRFCFPRAGVEEGR